MKIALGAARGLAFLHNAETQVIYRDFKTSNILLDSVGIFGEKNFARSIHLFFGDLVLIVVLSRVLFTGLQR